MSCAAPDKPSMYCRQCQYVLDGLPDNRCPECGAGFDPDDATTFLSPAQKRWRMSKPIRCAVSWSVLIAGTYVSLLAGSPYWWIGALGVFLIVRKWGPYCIPVRMPGTREFMVRFIGGWLLSPLLLVAYCVVPVLAVGAVVVLFLKLDAAGAPRALSALYLTSPVLALYGIFIVFDVLNIRKLWRPAPPGCCVNCHYDLKGIVTGPGILPPKCPNCHTPVPAK